MTSTRAWAIVARYARRYQRQLRAAAVVGMLAAADGCVVPPADALAATRPWTFDGVDGREFRSPHYRLLTTVADADVPQRLLRVLEAAYVRYADLLPPVDGPQALLEVELFATPQEWERFTRRLTGVDAAVYLSVGPGGYAYGDRFVCWLANADDLWGVAAHEGFHQYAARHFASRLPPALEEGLATCYESVRVGERSVEIDEASNARRDSGVALARKAGKLLPLDTLLRLHAGDLASRPLVEREGFYGQCRVLARMLKDDAKYAASFRRMLLALRDDRVADAAGTRTTPAAYVPGRVRPMLLTQLGVDWPTIERDYAAALATDLVPEPDR